MNTSITAPAPYLKPVPEPTELNREFWDGMRRHEFLVPRCLECGHYGWVPYPACRRCLSERQEWTPVSGRATVYSYTVVHRGPGAFNADAPYAIVAAALVEDPKYCVVLGNTVGIRHEDLQVGAEVRIVFEKITDEDVVLWRFGPAG